MVDETSPSNHERPKLATRNISLSTVIQTAAAEMLIAAVLSCSAEIPSDGSTDQGGHLPMPNRSRELLPENWSSGNASFVG